MENSVFTDFLIRIGKGEILLPENVDTAGLTEDFMIKYNEYQENAKNRNKESNEIR